MRFSVGLPVDHVDAQVEFVTGPAIAEMAAAAEAAGFDAAYVTDHPVRPPDVAYTVFSLLGIDPRKQLRTPEGRPVEILNEGSLIRELFT